MATAATVALADYAARSLSELLPAATSGNAPSVALHTMGQAARRNGLDASGGIGRNRRRGRADDRRRNDTKEEPMPFVLERTDFIVTHANNDDGDPTLRILLHASIALPAMSGDITMLLSSCLGPVLEKLKRRLTSRECYAHAACVVLQRNLRAMLQPPKRGGVTTTTMVTTVTTTEEKKIDDDDGEASVASSRQRGYLDAVAFIADGSLLPRKSGRSMLPMPSPPAVPFASPESDQLTRVVTVEVGKFWRRFLNDDGSVIVSDSSSVDTTARATTNESATVTMRGMIIPRGVTLIVGGGYHGKSTLLQAITHGIYDNIPRDGRERCVSHRDAVSVRAEDGRYVHNANVSAFIANLPSGKSVNGASIASKKDTSRFSTKDASGSTSQAANVIEALEGGASALLVDEDVSAANFMARDGRMRAMIMDEPITPLLYRVNGIFLSKQHEVSTVVVVGGVGEWLDVADAVVLMKDYVAYDGLKKARSVSYQFSYGHVQYAGRGVVHRLPWEVKEEPKGMMLADEENGSKKDDAMLAMSKEEDGKKPVPTLSPLRRRPEIDCVARKFRQAAVHLLESGSYRLWFYRDDDNDDCDNGIEEVSTAAGGGKDDEDDGMVDMSKCSQLAGGASEQLYGCGICVLWLILESQRRPDEDLPELLDRMDRELDRGGMNGLIASLKQNSAIDATNTRSNLLSELLSSHDALDLVETVGYAYRPRRHEVAMTLTRMRGMRFDILPEKAKILDTTLLSEEEKKRLEEESKKRALAELWANRRKR